ncbi:hypothetical protein IAE22_30480, partial [Bacillus sp. S34]|nr:hypothetical protein [Bacillus sp. S34]
LDVAHAARGQLDRPPARLEVDRHDGVHDAPAVGLHDVRGAAGGDRDLGVVVTGSTGLKVGTDSDEKAAAASKAYDARNAEYKAAQAKQAQLKKIVADSRKTMYPLNKARTAARATLTERKRLVTASKRALTAAEKTKNAAKIADAKQDLAAAQNAQSDAQAAYDRTSMLVK